MTIHIGLSLELDIKDYWTINRKRGVNYFIIRENINKDRWEQINLKLYISFLKPPDDKIKESSFNKIAILSNILHNSFRRY